MGTQASPLGLRLFLEGIEVPVISAQVTLQPDQPALAAIQIVPVDSALHFLPRTLVHLFYLDPEPPDVEYMGDEDATFELDGEKVTAEALHAPGDEAFIDNRYKLMFAGEVIGFNYSKTASTRQFVLQCMDLSSYWDTCYQWFADYSVGGNGLTDKSHQFVGAGAGLFDNIAGGHKWVIGRVLNTRPRTPEYFNVKGLLGGIIHLLEAIGGVRYRSDSFKGFNGVNDFFSVAELRYNLLGMVGAVEKDTTSAKIYASKAFNSWLRNGMTRMGNLLSFRQILNHVNSYIFHNIYPNPIALYRPSGDDVSTRSRKVTIKTRPLGRSGRGKRARAAVKKAFNALTVAKKKYVEGQNHAAEESAELATEQLLDIEVDATRNSASQDIFDIGLYKTRQAKKLLDGAVTNAEKVKTKDSRDFVSTVKESLSKIEEILSEPTTSGDLANLAKKQADRAEAARAPLQGLLRPVFKTITQTIEEEEGARLFNQLILPELFFVSPPKCNVIFPDQYYSFQFSRNFQREVTRLSCHGGIGLIAGRGGSKLLGRNYFAPNIKDVRGKTLYATMNAGARVLLPHEVHSGIIPKFEHVTDGHRWGVKAAKAKGKSDEFYKAGKIGYIQRLASFQFYLHRWAARTMTLNGQFNPHLVLGFPALVIDRSSPAIEVVRRIENLIERTYLPTQYLGKVIGLVHSVSQQGGNTQAHFGHARTHRGMDDEFVGVLTREVEVTKKVQKKVVISPRKMVESDTAFTDPDDDFELDLVAIPTETKAVREGYENALHLYTDGKLSKGTWVKRLGRVLKVKASSETEDFTKREAQEHLSIPPLSVENSEHRKEVDGVVKLELPKTITLTYQRKVGTGENRQIDITIEEAIKPGWYSPVWSNDKIGEDVYKQLLETEAITDNVSISADDQTEFLKRTYNEEMFATQESEVGAGGELNVVETQKYPAGVAVVIKPGSIEEAVDSITVMYDSIKQTGGDIHSFIRQFTQRPVANLIDIMGSQNFEFGDDGKPKSDDMVEGFHSRAFGDYNTDVKIPDKEGVETQAGEQALLGLFPGLGSSPPSRPSIVNGKDEVSIPPEFDPRGRARARVRVYMQELNLSRGLVG
jgi:hypothetical protein